MTDAKNMELNDEMMAKATGGTEEGCDDFEEDDRGRTETGTVIGSWGSGSNTYEVSADYGPTVVAHYHPIGLVEPGRRVKIELVGMGKWDIIEFLD